MPGVLKEKSRKVSVAQEEWARVSSSRGTRRRQRIKGRRHADASLQECDSIWPRLSRGALVLFLWKKKKYLLGMDGQAASCCVWDAGRRRRHRKQQFTNLTQILQITSVISECSEYFNKSAAIASFSAGCFTPVLSSSSLILLSFMPVLSSSSLPSPMSSLWLERNFWDQPYMWYVTDPQSILKKRGLASALITSPVGRRGGLSFNLSIKPSIIKPSFMKFLLINLTCICWTFMIP